MALVDVTELLHDPDFVDKLSIIRRTETVNTMGENDLTETTINTIGSVQPITGKDLQRLPEMLRVQDVKSFWVKCEIKSDGTNGVYPDLIVWKCNRYAVKTIDDWTNFGAGWTQGICVREKPSL